MKKAIKSFCAFTSLGYRLIMFIVIPALVILFNALCLFKGGEIGGIISFIFSFSTLIFVDVISDKWVLNGFYLKSNSSLEFMQTSNKFLGFIRGIVIVDMVHRILMYVGLYVIIVILGVIMLEEEVWIYGYSIYAYFPLLMFVISQIILWIERHFNSVQSIWIAGCMATVAMSIGMSGLTYFGIRFTYSPLYLVVVYGGLALLTIAISIVTVWYSLKKVRESYYDK